MPFADLDPDLDLDCVPNKTKKDFLTSQRICMPNLVLIGAAVWHVSMKQKCDRRTEGRTEGRTDGSTEGRTDGRTDGRRVFHSPPFFNAGDNNGKPIMHSNGMPNNK